MRLGTLNVFLPVNAISTSLAPTPEHLQDIQTTPRGADGHLYPWKPNKDIATSITFPLSNGIIYLYAAMPR